MTVARSIDRANSAYWNTLCGTNLARSLGIADRSAASLAIFDAWYLRMYPYLDKHLRLAELRGKSVLEVGLGYGTVAQRLAEHGAFYRGLDIAAGPVEMVNYRLRLHGLPGSAVQGSVLQAPFGDASIDRVVAIGCFHHTGDMQRAIDESYRMLRAGGELTLMVYYGLSYRRWLLEPRAAWRELVGGTAVATTIARHYDDTDGEAPPHTDFVSRRRLRRMCRRFRSFGATLENIDRAIPGIPVSFDWLVSTPLPKLFGLDIYARAVK
jgi:SAM-dependent methyltransferase